MERLWQRRCCRRAATGQAAALVDLDAFDVTTGASIFLINDKTGVDGLYQIVLNPGTYDITYTPPVALRLAGYRRAGVVVSGGPNTVLTLPDTLLEPGLSVVGLLQDSRVPPNLVPNEEIRFFDSATRQSVFVPARTYDLIDAPAAGSSLLLVRVPGIVVAADRSVPTVSLAQGVLLEGDVHDPSGVAVVDADADLFDAFTGDAILLPPADHLPPADRPQGSAARIRGRHRELAVAIGHGEDQPGPRGASRVHRQTRLQPRRARRGDLGPRRHRVPGARLPGSPRRHIMSMFTQWVPESWRPKPIP